MKKINLIAASRERPRRMSNVLDRWLSNSKSPSSLRIVISIDNDDPTCDQYFDLLTPISEKYGTELIIIKNDNKCTVDAINSAKSYIDGDLIIIFSDDTDCFEDWDYMIIKFSKKLNGKYIIKTSDGIGKVLITMPIFSKEYLDSFDYIYNPLYKHMFCDTELTCVAHLLDCVIPANKFVFKHLHYTQQYHDKDMIDDKNQSTFYPGLAIFRERIEKNFDLEEEEIKGKIPNEITKWMREEKTLQ
jgi:hypothetical protein